MALVKRILIDDTDIRINYSGQGWFLNQGSLDNAGSHGQPYNYTSHGTNSNGSLSFVFKGQSITLFGTKEFTRTDKNTRWDPGWECFVDGLSISAGDPSRDGIQNVFNNWVLCQQPTLNDGQHTFTVNVTTSGKTFRVDRFAFLPSPSSSYDEDVFEIDANNPNILLDSKWDGRGKTTSTTSKKGAQAKFSFVGTSVTWLGYITNNSHIPASGSYSIDGGPPTPFFLNSLPPDATDAAFYQAFFTTPNLTPDSHDLLVVYNGGDSDGPAIPLTLSLLRVTPPSKNHSSSGTPDSTNPLPTNVGSGSHESSSAPLGAIIGGVIGGMALVVIVLFLVLWQRRRRQRMRVAEPMVDIVSVLTPFVSMRRPSEASLSKYQPYNFNPQPTSVPPFRKPSLHAVQTSSLLLPLSSQSHHISGSTNNSSDNHRHTHAPGIDTTNVGSHSTQLAATPVLHQNDTTSPAQANTTVQDMPPLYTAT